MKDRPIVITGFMGSGKTTVALALARRLEYAVFDLDEIITVQQGFTPGVIIERDGEEEFRQIETRVLREVLPDASRGVVALGGGAWTVPRNRDLIQQHDGITVALVVPFELCWKRIVSAGDDRPLGRDKPRARKLYEERQVLYNLAQLHFKIDENQSVSEVSDEIAGALRIQNS